MHLSNEYPELKAVIAQVQAKYPVSYSFGFRSLFSHLRTNTFKGNPSLFSLDGRVKATYKELERYKLEFACIAETVGIADAHYSTAMLMEEHQTKPQGYNFVEYMPDGSPLQLVIEELWDPRLGAEAAVPNDIALMGGSQVIRPRGAIVTGTNTAGKSSLLTRVVATAVTARTVTVVPAQAAQISLFKYIQLIARVRDKPGDGQSHAQAEARVAEETLTAVASLPADAPALVCADELLE